MGNDADLLERKRKRLLHVCLHHAAQHENLIGFFSQKPFEACSVWVDILACCRFPAAFKAVYRGNQRKSQHLAEINGGRRGDIIICMDKIKLSFIRQHGFDHLKIHGGHRLFKRSERF